MPENPTMWDRLKSFADSGFGRGLMITAAALVISMGLVAGAMGAGLIGTLTVNGLAVSTFEAGVSAGVLKAVEFMTASYLGLGTLLTGGLIGKLIKDRVPPPEIIHDEVPVAREREREQVRAVEPQKEVQKETAKETAKETQDDIKKSHELVQELQQLVDAKKRENANQTAEYIADRNARENDLKAEQMRRQADEALSTDSSRQNSASSSDNDKRSADASSSEVASATRDSSSDITNNTTQGPIQNTTLKDDSVHVVNVQLADQTNYDLGQTNNNSTLNQTNTNYDASQTNNNSTLNQANTSYDVRQANATTNMLMPQSAALGGSQLEKPLAKNVAIPQASMATATAEASFAAKELQRRAERDVDPNARVI